jgi:CHAT domain-containing protein
VKGLADTLPNSTTFIDRDFSLTAIEALLNQYNILHFATHAAVMPNDASQSFILLGNGDQPTLRDIENWSLFNVDLVVLSACETGLGGFDNNGEQILGMGYLFQSRGARAVIASLWQVSDRSTQILMNTFYTALENGSTKAEALRQAQIALITGDESLTSDQERTLLVEVEEGGRSPQTSQLSHPYYWAPFILIGNGL